MEVDEVLSRVEQGEGDKEAEEAAHDNVEELAAGKVLGGHRVQDQEEK